MSSHTGIVQKGTQRATLLGFPTVNIPLADTTVSGIYAARVTIGDAVHYAAVFADQRRKVLEAHLLDFSGALREKNVTIELCKKIRENTAFDNDALLQAAILDDIANVRDYFKK